MKKRIITFILGSLCFIIAQPLLRLPILNYLQRSTKFTMFLALNPLLVGILIAFSAGVFEEGFRFIFKSYLLKPIKTDIVEPIIFGLGHGLAEAVIVLGPFLFTVPLQSLALGIFERFLAIILHIGLTVIVWNGFQLNKRIKYLIIAILIHGSVNSLIPILSSVKNAILLIEGALLLTDICIVIYIYKSKKIYKLQEGKYEKK
ncbi:MAG: YhfC family glutamic-type intramembrane protease [Tissierella sp.]|uniref:YhfC family glutamic-type intramembrane protease n=1 Tax=Tissierella sp. TaxID=41274 RepID=UPI003F94A7CF